MNFFERTIAVFAPGTAQKRMRARMAIDMMESHKRKFEGAGQGRRFGKMGTQNVSVNQELEADLPWLRSRSRDLYQNNPYGKNGIKRIANNVVGVGIVPTPRSKNAGIIDKVKEFWAEWADSTTCDFDGKSNFYGLQKLAMKSVAKTGECIARRVYIRANGKVTLKIQLLAPEFLDSSKSQLEFAGGEYIMNGVHFQSNGQIKGYWIHDKHPFEHTAVSSFVYAKDIIHMFDPEDPGQVRGIPFLASTILRMKDFDEFEDAKLMQQKISALFGIIISGGDDEVTVGQDITDSGADLERLEPGEIRRLETGKTVTVVDPPSVDGFADYSRQSLQGQAVGLGITYESYTGDLSNVNFSSGRMGWIEMNRNIEDWVWNMMVPQFCEKAWGWFIDYLVLSQSSSEYKDVKASWTAPRRQMIDPVKEVSALIKEVRGGFKTWSEAVREMGYNPDEVIAELKKDKKLFDEAGIMPESDPRFDPARMSAQAKMDKQKQGKV